MIQKKKGINKKMKWIKLVPFHFPYKYHNTWEFKSTKREV